MHLVGGTDLSLHPGIEMLQRVSCGGSNGDRIIRGWLLMNFPKWEPILSLGWELSIEQILGHLKLRNFAVPGLSNSSRLRSRAGVHMIVWILFKSKSLYEIEMDAPPSSNEGPRVSRLLNPFHNCIVKTQFLLLEHIPQQLEKNSVSAD